MRILALSDSHGRQTVIEDIIERHYDINTLLFAGDGAKEFCAVSKFYPEKRMIAVCGNNDSLFSDFSPFEIVKVENTKIFLTHGNNYHIGFGYEKIIESARNFGCNLIICGHTHVPKIYYNDGIHLVNPGSVSRSRKGRNSYAVIDVLPSGEIVAKICEV